MLRKWLREPLLHFLLIGGALFLLYGLQNNGVGDQSKRIELTETDINRLLLIWEKKRLRPPTQAELQGLIEQQIREEVLYREALRMGLDKNDSMVRRRLAQKVEFISKDLAAQVEPTDAELADYLATHAERFEQPARISFVQVYFSTDKRGVQAEKVAQDVLAELRQADSKLDINRVGDPFMMGLQHQHLSEYGVSRLFGKDFARALFKLSAGKWQGPVSSGYGLHLVRIDNKTAAQPAELDAVRDKLRNEWFAEQRRRLNEAFYQGLRQQYEIVVKDVVVNNIVASAKP